MPIGLPSFNYNSMMTPGGVGQGLGAVAAAIANAGNKRREMEQGLEDRDSRKQGLAQMEARANQSLGMDQRRLDEGYRHNIEMEARANQSLGMDQSRLDEGYRHNIEMEAQGVAKQNADVQRYKDTQAASAQEWARGQPQRDADLNKTNAQAQSYSKGQSYRGTTANELVNIEKLVNDSYRDEENAALGNPDYLPTPTRLGFGTPTPARKKLLTREEHRAQYFATRPGLQRAYDQAMQAPAPGGQGGDLASRAHAAYGGNIPPGVQQRLDAIANNTPDAAQAQQELESLFGAPAAPVANPNGLDLLGNPIQ